MDDWPKEEIEPGRFVDVDPEILARGLMEQDQLMGEAMDMVGGPDDPRMLPWEKQPQEVRDRWIAKAIRKEAGLTKIAGLGQDWDASAAIRETKP